MSRLFTASCLDRMCPFRIVSIYRFHPANMTVELDVQLGEARIALAQYLEMPGLATGLATGRKAGSAGRLQRGSRIGIVMLMMFFLVFDRDGDAVPGETGDL